LLNQVNSFSTTEASLVTAYQHNNHPLLSPLWQFSIALADQLGWVTGHEGQQMRDKHEMVPGGDIKFMRTESLFVSPSMRILTELSVDRKASEQLFPKFKSHYMS
jgi:hypothetical protein